MVVPPNPEILSTPHIATGMYFALWKTGESSRLVGNIGNESRYQPTNSRVERAFERFFGVLSPQSGKVVQLSRLRLGFGTDIERL
jgi:hypothetical protein